MKRVISLTFLALALSLALFAFQNETCPIDDSSAYFTGQTKVESGKLLKLYKCARGHKFYVVSK